MIECPTCGGSGDIHIQQAVPDGATRRWVANCIACGEEWRFEG